MPDPELFISRARRRLLGRVRWPWVAATAALLVAVGIGVYFAFIKAPGDVTNPDVEFEREQAPVPRAKPKADHGSDWPQYGLTKARTRYLAADRDFGPPFRRVWSFNGSVLLEFSPILANGTLFLQRNNGGLFAIRASTGRVRWKRQSGYKNASSPAYGDGRIYTVSLHPRHATAYRANTGRQVWRRSLPGRAESSPVYDRGKVYFGCECGLVFALDADTGRTVWTTRLSGPIKGAPALYKGSLYVGDYGGRFWALRTRDGGVKWRSSAQGGSFGRTGRFYSTPAVAFGRVYVGSLDGRVYSFSIKDGRIAWSQSTGGYVYASPAIADTPRTGPTVYVGSYSGGFFALDARTGRVRWRHRAPGRISGAASVIGETVYFSNLQTKTTRALSARTGRKLWALNRGAFNPAISDGKRVYITGYAGLYAFRPAGR